MEIVEEKAYSRLRQVRDRGLWDGVPPVPVEHIVEHILNLTISWEVVIESEGEQILASLRPDKMEVVLNELHRSQFDAVVGLERFSLAHEAGHADVFALTALPEQLGLLATSTYRPLRRSASRGPVVVLANGGATISRDVLREAMKTLKESDRARQAAGEDTPLARRTVDHYAAVLLMPEEAVRSAARGLTLSGWSDIRTLAKSFEVSLAAMRIRLEECGLIHGVTGQGEVILQDPSVVDQGDLFR